MAAYIIHRRFALAIASGIKSHVIRPDGKRRHVLVGEKIQLYAGTRTKGSRKLVSPDPICTKILDLTIERVSSDKIRLRIAGPGALGQDGIGIDMQQVAQEDGFRHTGELVHWIEQFYGLPFSGVLIQWRQVAPSVQNT